MIEIVYAVAAFGFVLLILAYGFYDHDIAVDLYRTGWRRDPSKPAEYPTVDGSRWPVVKYSARKGAFLPAVPTVGSCHPYRDGWRVKSVYRSDDLFCRMYGVKRTPTVYVTYARGGYVMLPSMEVQWQPDS